MNKILDKCILFVCCLILYVQTFNNNYVIFPILIVLFFSCLSVYVEHNVSHLFIYLCFMLVCCNYPALTIFISLIMYDLIFTKLQYSLIFIFYLLSHTEKILDTYIITFIALFCILCFYLKYKTLKYEHLELISRKALDDSKELALLQEEKNRSILENQDYEINIATLSERNRISKEIHDHIGHVLSRSLIQIGALLTINKEPLIQEELTSLKNSLSEGMDSIRASIHNMHDESIDLYSSIQSLVKDFKYCKIQFEYDIANPPLLKIKYCFIAIVKEALSNIIKHSDATKVSIILTEEPSLYRLIIEDNGTISDKMIAIARRIQISCDYVDGMGLQNMMDRVKGFQGNFQITVTNGFQIFVTIPKENSGGT